MSEEPKERRDKRARRRRSQFIQYLLVYLGVMSLATFFLKFIVAKLNTEIPLLASLITGCVAILGFILQTAFQKKNSAPRDSSPSDIWALLWDGLSNIIWQIRKDSRKVFAIFFVLSSTSIVLAANHVCGRTLQMVQSVTSTVMEEVPSPPAHVQSNNTQPPVATPTPDKTMKEPPPEPEFVLLDPGRNCTLEQDTFNTLYFLDGPYEILDWEDEDEIQQKVSDCIQSYLDQSRPNEFDQFAPEDIRAEAARASEQERWLSNSEELDSLIMIRKEIFETYPKYSLAHMIAESYNRYGLEYVEVNGNFSTIEYYYGQSIQWLLVSLSYASDDSDTIRMLLSSIQMRYHDIASFAPSGSESGRYAMKLYAAYTRVLSEF